MKYCFTILFAWACIAMHAQPSVKVEVSSDTISIGEIVEVTYTIENGEGEFDPPEFGELPLISGPNTSTSFVYQNGKMSSSQSYAYIFRPMEEGKIKIPKAAYKEDSKILMIEPVEIIVSQNGQKQNIRKTVPQKESTPDKPAREKKKF